MQPAGCMAGAGGYCSGRFLAPTSMKAATSRVSGAVAQYFSGAAAARRRNAGSVCSLGPLGAPPGRIQIFKHAGGCRRSVRRSAHDAHVEHRALYARVPLPRAVQRGDRGLAVVGALQPAVKPLVCRATAHLADQLATSTSANADLAGASAW